MNGSLNPHKNVRDLRVTGGMACTYARSIRARNLGIVRGAAHLRGLFADQQWLEGQRY